MDMRTKALEAHKAWQGKIEVISKAKIDTNEDLAVAYTPGVAEPCKEIARDESLAYEYTSKGNIVAVVTDGTAVLGLGDIGPAAAMPVMEGKCVLFKEFAGVDAFPICIDSKDTDEIVRTIHLISKSFGGINLEDIAAPRCFEIERKLKEICDIPVFHDDQHGTAIVALAALINAARVAKKELLDLKIVINGAGAAGISIAKLIMAAGVKDITLCDINGVIEVDDDRLSQAQRDMAACTNPTKKKGLLKDAIVGADVFIGVSRANLLTAEDIKTMAEKAIVFAMANPAPEIMPDEALKGGALVVGTGRSDFPNQINNVLVFPGIFKGTLEVRAK